ncbi:hypothetical protein [Aggregatibacter actinomycetemcomitans]|jgi:uncharacterized protein PM0314|uniref:hypothetical protein n=1 Tax=Aggregatibacter actinomycetemcomitans TaxID=714 RepID=UPI001E64FF5E|nr:hypothetical protein [Aggregatibacter actinomycetemcomitans]DAY11788.1 MAG TPA: hypothetical protein [Caudoviricetes sp.]
MKKLIALLSILVPMVVNAAPVDGYKDLKFGMTLEDVKSKDKLCESEWHIPEINNPFRAIPGFFYCDKFAFNAGYVRAELRFIGNTLQTVKLQMTEVPAYPKEKLLPLLTEKYGEPVISKEDLMENNSKVGSGKKSGKKGELIAESYSFADGSVLLTTYNENGKYDPVKIYYKSQKLINIKDEEAKEADKQFLLNEL